jgi:hypothetical protein
MSGGGQTSLRAQITSWVLVVVGAAIFIRELITAQLWDFAVIYTASRAWLEGKDPYDQPYLNQWWLEHGGSSGMSRDVSWLPQVVPPTTQVVMAPLAMVPAGSVRYAWLLMVVVLVGLQVAALASLSGATGSRRRLFCAYALAMGTLQLGMISGQPAVPAVAIIVMAVWAASRGHDLAAAILFGVAAALKVQLGLPLIALYLYMRRWRVAGGALGVWLGIIAVAVAQLMAHVPGWWQHWQLNLESLTAGGANDFSHANPSRYHLVNLQLLVNVFVANRALTFAISWLLLAIAGVMFLRFTWRETVEARGRDPQRELHFIAFFAPLTLLPVYHRYYDATLMSLTMAWAISEWDTPDPRLRRVARSIAVVLLALLMPLVAAPAHAIDMGYLPKWLDDSWLWNATITAQHVWVLLIVMVAMLSALATRYGRSPALVAPAPATGES